MKTKFLDGMKIKTWNSHIKNELMYIPWWISSNVTEENILMTIFFQIDLMNKFKLHDTVCYWVIFFFWLFHLHFFIRL